MKVTPGHPLHDAWEHDVTEYLVLFWSRDDAQSVVFTLSEVDSVWEVTAWVEAQTAAGELRDYVPEVCAVVRDRGDVGLVRLTADVWREVSEGRRTHPGLTPTDGDA